VTGVSAGHVWLKNTESTSKKMNNNDIEFPKHCHNCLSNKLLYCSNKGLSETIYEIDNGKLGNFVQSVLVDEEGKPLEYIFCEDCENVVYELKVTKKWIMKYDE
jgi:hypothetical protein